MKIYVCSFSIWSVAFDSWLKPLNSRALCTYNCVDSICYTTLCSVYPISVDGDVLFEESIIYSVCEIQLPIISPHLYSPGLLLNLPCIMFSEMLFPFMHIVA